MVILEADNLEQEIQGGATAPNNRTTRHGGMGFYDRRRLGGPLGSGSLWATPWVNSPDVTPQQINGSAGTETTRATFKGQYFRNSNLRLTARGVWPYTRPVLAGS